MREKKVRHVLGLSGGKDSSALAVYMRDKVPEMEYFFTDTGAELPETYAYLDQLEGVLGKPIIRLSAERDFDHLLYTVYNGFLPSPNTRWCTRELKIKPFEQWVGNDPTFTYIAIRADEERDGYRSTKQNITPVFPFKLAGLVRADIERILQDFGLGVPEYYRWRSRSGCYFCFFQRKHEWRALAEEHPDLFEKAKAYEKSDTNTGVVYSWSQGETLQELIARVQSLDVRETPKRTHQPISWQELLARTDQDDATDESCLICTL